MRNIGNARAPPTCPSGKANRKINGWKKQVSRGYVQNRTLWNCAPFQIEHPLGALVAEHDVQ
jgi:hypothetical protein